MQRRLIALALLLAAFAVALALAVVLTVRSSGPEARNPPTQSAPLPGSKNEGIGVLDAPKQ